MENIWQRISKQEVKEEEERTSKNNLTSLEFHMQLATEFHVKSKCHSNTHIFVKILFEIEILKK